MKKNDFNSNQEFEKLLKEKMNELSTSVDCFNKISARAFPEKDSDFSDCGLTVSDLENVTGKRRIPPVLRWVSAAAAIVLFIGIIPKTAIINSLRDSDSSSSEVTDFSGLLKEIQEETESGSYYIENMPLSDYISRDVLVTPLYSCPFRKSTSDMNVRIFTKIVGGLRTNQVYAVQYHDTYSEENIVAVAETGVSFSSDEVSTTAMFSTMFLYEYGNLDTAAASFECDSDGMLTDKDGNPLSVAGFSNISLYKEGNTTSTIQTDVIYYRYNYGGDYYYDIMYTDGDGEKMPIERDSWENVFYSDGPVYISLESPEVMNKTEIFSESYETESDVWYITPWSVYPWNQASPTEEYTVEVHNSYETTGEILNQISLPYDASFQRRLRLYIGKKAPVAFSLEEAENSKTYYSTMELTKADGTVDIDDTLARFNDELTQLELEEKKSTLTDAEKTACEIEKQKLLTEIENLELDFEFTKLAMGSKYEEQERQKAEEAERQKAEEAERSREVSKNESSQQKTSEQQ